MLRRHCAALIGFALFTAQAGRHNRLGGGGELVRRVPSVVMTRKDYIAQPARLITADMRSLTALSPDEIALFDLLRRASPARTRSTGACTTCTVL